MATNRQREGARSSNNCQIEWKALLPTERCEFIGYRFDCIYKKAQVPVGLDFDQIYTEQIVSALPPNKSGGSPRPPPASNCPARTVDPAGNEPNSRVEPTTTQFVHPPTTSEAEDYHLRPGRRASGSRFHDGNGDDFEPFPRGEEQHPEPSEFTELLVPRRKGADRHKLRRLRKSMPRWRGIFLYRSIRRSRK